MTIGFFVHKHGGKSYVDNPKEHRKSMDNLFHGLSKKSPWDCNIAEKIPAHQTGAPLHKIDARQ